MNGEKEPTAAAETGDSHEPQPAAATQNGTQETLDMVELRVQQNQRPAEEPGTVQIHEWTPEGDHESKRVKVYELQGPRWVDQGTAFCYGQFTDDVNEALLIAKSETNPSEVVLSTTIRSSDVYQRQQETLIVWTEPDGVDYALSFQDPDGCAEVWNFILEVQRHMNMNEEQTVIGTSSPFIGPELSSAAAQSIYRHGSLPAPQLGIIPDIDRAIKQFVRTQGLKDAICEYIVQEEYIKSLVDLMAQAEDLESIENLHALCNLMLTILTMNDHHIFEHILDEDLFYGVVGILEYDPEFPAHKANYRAFLSEKSRFLQPVPITDTGIQRKIHHTYRLQFLKDVVLARAIDDSTFNVMQAGIIFNQIDIIQHIQQDATFLRNVIGVFPGGVAANPLPLSGGVSLGPQVFGKGKDGSEDMSIDAKEPQASVNGASPVEEEDTFSLRRQVIFLIQQLCSMGKSVQLPARMALFRNLAERGILFAVQWALTLPESDASKDNRAVLGASGEILATILDHDVTGARVHVLRHLDRIEKGLDQSETLLILMCKGFATSRDMAVQSQIGDTLKVFLDIPPPEPKVDIGAQPTVGVKLLARSKDEPANEKFLDYFYKGAGAVHMLFKPFEDIPEHKQVKEPVLLLTREKTNVYLYLCELLCNFASQHSFRSHFFILTSNIVARVASLLKARDKHLRLAALKYFRLSLKQNNRNHLQHLIKHDVLLPILQLTLQESRRDNLLSSTCFEFFEHMRRDNIKELIKHCMTSHEALVKKLVETPLGKERFVQFIKRWEINNEPLPVETAPARVDARTWPNAVKLDMDEENYFGVDDEDEDDYIQPISAQWARGTNHGPAPLGMNNLKRKRRQAVSSLPKGMRPAGATHTRTPSLGKLVDYDEEEEDTYDVLSAGIASGSFISSRFKPSPASGSGPSSRPLTPTPYMSGEGSDDEQDDLLESLIQQHKSPPRMGGKRRRALEDDEDELEALSSKAKRPDLGLQKSAAARGIDRSKLGGDDPPGGGNGAKKLKLKLGSSLQFASSLPLPVKTPPVSIPPTTGAKDADTG